MQRDIRATPIYLEAEALYTCLRQVATKQISDAADINVSPKGHDAVFTGTLAERLEGVPPTRICRVNLTSGRTQVLTSGPNSDRLPMYSPDGRRVAFLSDAHERGDFQLYLLDSVDDVVRRAPPVDGWVEYLHWSPDGKRILLGVAGRGADVSGAQGAIATKRSAEDVPAWLPAADAGDESHRWRSAWVYELADDCVRQASAAGSNIWEAAWCGNEAFAAVASSGPGEGLWYSAGLYIVEMATGQGRLVYSPRDQLGCPAASPSGEHLAIVEAVCSDRGIVAGELRLVDSATGHVRAMDTHEVDIAYTEWRSDRLVLLAGHRGLESVVGLYDVASDTFAETWLSPAITTGSRYITVSGFDESADCVLVGEGFTRAPEIAVIRGGRYRTIRSLDASYAERASVIDAVEQVSWLAPDGLEMQGWLLLPKGGGPYPLVMNLHGGPIGHWRPTWLGRRTAWALMLLQRGYAIFFPNPRGSSGRGQQFARRVVGEMGGADAQDCLSGLDHLVSHGLADAGRLGLIGSSYGGYLTSWLITQDPRFAAAVAVAPITNHVTAHLISNIPHFFAMFLADRYENPAGKYFHRSPVMYAFAAKTPTLNICGALDRCTPPEEAVQFHNALLENGVESVLLRYPEEGHGIRKFPAMIDYAARVVAWFEEHMHGSRT